MRKGVIARKEREKKAKIREANREGLTSAGNLFLSWFGIRLPKAVKPYQSHRVGSQASYRDHEHRREIDRHLRQNSAKGYYQHG